MKMKKIVLPVVLLLIVTTAYATYLITTKFMAQTGGGLKESTGDIEKPLSERISFDLVKFKSEEEFKQYLENAPDSLYGSPFLGLAPMRANMEMTAEDSVDMATPTATAFGSAPKTAGGSPDRTSQTNVQVEGIDEPDILKVGGKNIFTSFNTGMYRRYPTPIVEPMLFEETTDTKPTGLIPPEPEKRDGTNIIQAFPPEEIKKLGGIEEIGELLYVNEMLVLFTYDTIYGYDVSNPELPVQAWDIPYGEDSYYKDARLFGDKLYLVTETNIRWRTPCPIKPLMVNGESFEIACTDIYHPKSPVQTETTFTVYNIDTKSGNINNQISFVGSGTKSVMYMSPKNIYITYSYSEDYVNIFLGFMLKDESGLFPEEIVEKVKKLASYDISQESKMMELELIMNDFIYSLPEDDELEIQTKFQDKMDEYIAQHTRDFSSTGVVKIERDGLKIDKTGQIPGYPLNQFSLDEYENNLRIATTSGDIDAWSSMGKVNDVYILNKNMEKVGEILDLGKDEKIYSARFIGNRGYVVTFRQTDPFYVLDLSNPKNPKMTGELKIPGYSSYLHPLAKNIILGIGKEGSKVKLALFDVTDSTNPTEVDKYMLDEYYSEAVNNHHAFLQDDRHNVFFLPGSKGGYIFSYDNNELEIEKAISTNGVKRAVYMDDYMYIVGTEEIVVIEETTWDRVGEYEF